MKDLGLSIFIFAVHSWVNKRPRSFCTFTSKHQITIKVFCCCFMSISWSLYCFLSAVSFIAPNLLINFDQIYKTYGFFPDRMVVAVWIVKISHSCSVLKYFLCSKQIKVQKFSARGCAYSNFSWKKSTLNLIIL